jgi:penicillin G amidase
MEIFPAGSGLRAISIFFLNLLTPGAIFLILIIIPVPKICNRIFGIIMAIRISRGVRLVKAAGLLAFTALLTWALSTRIGMIPPLGHLTSPWQGFWQNMERDGVRDLALESDMLRSTVTVHYDERGVPHIFADNDYDLYFAQGFVTARDRLWQIDFQTRAAAGRLAEIVGPAAVDYDRAQRRLGMMYGAEVNAASLTADPRTATKVQAYADGYNAWLERLSPRHYPVEYKIMDFKPEPFSPLGTALLLMNMSQTLSSGTRAHALTNARALLDEDVYRLFYPDELPWTDPIIPPDQPWDFEPLAPAEPEPGFVPEIVRDLPVRGHDPGIGSNSWAVDGSRSATGYPILASDPHLGVNLPSLWYEVQLHSTGANNHRVYELRDGGSVAGIDYPTVTATKTAYAEAQSQSGSEPDVASSPVSTYGASLPGAPGVIIGFNRDVAWGVTNTGSNTLDIFEIEFRDDRREEYLHNGEWKPVRQRIEKIPVRGGETVIDTVLYTHHGPVTQPHDEKIASGRFPGGHAIRWIAHLPDHNPLLAVYKYNRARSQEEFEAALRHFTNLPQNITYADRHGNISMGHMGAFPVRFFGQGSYIGNGRDPAYDWDQFVPFEHLPRSFNPERGFVSSANQAPATRDYPYYLGRGYYGFSRGARINRILAGTENVTGAFFEEMLMDNRSLQAEKILPFLLSELDGRLRDRVWVDRDRAANSQPASSQSGGAQESEANDDIAQTASIIYKMLNNWDCTFDTDSPVAHFYAGWEQRLQRELWKPLMDNSGVYLDRPNITVTFRLLLDGEHGAFPVDVTETIRRTFRETVDAHVRRYGSDPAKWYYGRDRDVRVGHLAFLPGFGRDDFMASGSPETINATGTRHAPSWRMVVELGPELRARGHYPGGQTGNPGHPGYDRFIDDWASGAFYDLHFWDSPADAKRRATSTLSLNPKNR